MRKIIMMALITVCCFGTMVSCGGKDDSSATKSNTTSTTTQNTETPSTPNTNTQTTPNTNTQTTPNTNTPSKNETTTQVSSYKDIKVINNTGVEINGLFVSSSDEDNWGSDILNANTLPAGYEINIRVVGNEKTAYWDLMVKDAQGNSITWVNLNLFSMSEITLNYDTTTGSATANYR